MKIEVTDAQMANIQRVLNKRNRDFFKPPENEGVFKDDDFIKEESLASMHQALTASFIKDGDGLVFKGNDALISNDDKSINVDLPNGAQDINAIVNLEGDLFHVFCMSIVAIQEALARAGVASAYLSLIDDLSEPGTDLYILSVAELQTDSFTLIIPIPRGETITHCYLHELTNCEQTQRAIHVACSVDWYESEFVDETSDSLAYKVLTSPRQ